MSKINKKTRNVISGILVGIASVYAVINFADIPAQDVRSFILATVLFIVGIVVLALLAVSVFKLLAWLKNRLTSDDDDARDNATAETGQDSPDDKA
jgi:phosphotransferase system  glucose/maltose/N-acetylglucosamine-specific IIC component